MIWAIISIAAITCALFNLGDSNVENTGLIIVGMIAAATYEILRELRKL